MSLNIVPIIVEIREFKAKIKESIEKLKEIDKLCKEMNMLLILQDLANATNLQLKKSQRLRERLAAAKAELKKISGIGEEMDGNTTTNEEEEFIDALKDEMPEVFKNIEANFGLLDHIDSELKLVLKYKDINKMQAVKKDLDEASVKVDQCESLVVKLDNEVIEWDAFKKLCRRDDELNELEKLVEDLSKDLEGEM